MSLSRESSPKWREESGRLASFKYFHANRALGAAQFGEKRAEAGAFRQGAESEENRASERDYRSDARAEGLETKPQRKLDEAWQIVLTGDLAKGSATAAPGIGRIELRTIESVEELRAELNAVPFVLTKLGVLKYGEVKVLYAVGAYVRFCSRVAERTSGSEVGRVAVREYGSVEPMGQPIVQRTGGQMGQSSSGWAGTRHVRNSGVAQRAGATANDNGETALEGHDRIDSPSGN